MRKMSVHGGTWFALAILLSTPPGAGQLEVQMSPLELPAEMEPGDFVLINFTLRLNCQDLLISRASSAEVNNDIWFVLDSEGTNGMVGPTLLNFQDDIEKCQEQAEIEISKTAAVGTSRNSSPLKPATLELSMRASTSEPYKETWNGTLDTIMGISTDAEFIFASNQKQIRLEGFGIVELEFFNFGNAIMNVTPSVKDAESDILCGTFKPESADIAPYQRPADMFRFEFIPENVTTQQTCIPRAHVRIDLDNRTAEDFILEGTPMTLVASQDEAINHESPAPTNVGLIGSLIATALIRRKSRSERSERSGPSRIWGWSSEE